MLRLKSVCLLALIVLAAPLWAGPNSAQLDEQIAALQQQIKLLKENEKVIDDLKKQVDELVAEKNKREQDAELKKLMQDAQQLASQQKESASIGRKFLGGERQQSQLNPEISMTGDFFGTLNSEPEALNHFALREAEFHIISPLDPFTRGKFFLGVPGDGSLEVGEAYMEWLNLPLHANLKIGKFHHQFGVLNRWHEHALPQFDRPRVLNNLFGGDALCGMGLAANFLLPSILAQVNELDVELTTGGDGHSFDASPDNPIVVAHMKNYYDVSRNAYIEWGLSGAFGANDAAKNYYTTLGAFDLTYRWVPVGREHYRTVEFRNEFFYSRRQTEAGNLNRKGFYSYVTNRLGYRSWVGLRLGYSELPLSLEKETEWDISPYFDFWQSEFVMLRLQYSYTRYSVREDGHAVYLQTVWAMGPHKHEAY